MYPENINLSTQDILDKEFKIDTRGYRLKEVDQYLDIIISDYEQFNKIIKNQEIEKERLLNEIMLLKKELRNVKTNIDIVKNTETKEITNVDLLRRLSQLEKTVYGKDE